ncbi:MAG: 2'-5' RNA ligase family protein [Carbonactinosporaceae bacterium]
MGVRSIGVAIAIPEPYGGELQGWRDRFGDPLAQSVPAHVTVLPPTEVDEAALPEIEAHLRGVAARQERFAIHLRGTGSFRPVSPVVFVLLAEGIAACERLERLVRSGPLARELRFTYHPHVTIAHDLAGEVLDHAFDKLAGYEAVFPVRGFSLYEHGVDGVWRTRREFVFGRE